MSISNNFTRRHLTVVALTMGIGFPLYALADTQPADTTTKVVTQTTTTKTVVKHNRHHVTEQRERAAEANKADAVNNANALNAEANNANATNANSSQDSVKRVVWKNGVVFHDVEPTGQVQGAPTSTSDTLKGGVTTAPSN